MSRTISSVVNSALEPLGIEIRRASPHRTRGDYYPPSATCQIPSLSAKFEQFFGRRSEGQFVEVGAFDGIAYSNSWGLSERGWSGLMIEPISEYAELCRKNHQSHPLVKVLNTAVSGSEEEIEFRVGGAFTTSHDEQAAEFEGQEWARDHLTDRRVRRPAVTLDSILKTQGTAVGFDVAIVDVEGHEVEVFRGFDVRVWEPKMLIVELTDVHPELTSVRAEHARLYAQLLAQGYTVAFKDAINTMFVRNDVYRAAVGLTIV